MKEKIYYSSVFVLCVVSVFFAVRDFSGKLSEPERIADMVIYALFIIDYVVRLFLAENKRDFFEGNVFDLLAIIPLNSAFRAFRLFRFAKLLRLFKFFRAASVFGRLVSRSGRFLDTNGFKYMLMLSAGAILAAAGAIMYFEGMSFPDAIWWSFVTATTVGYGDLSPTTTAGRIVAALLMLVGIGLIGSLTSTITSFFLDKTKSEETPEPDSSDQSRIQMVMVLYNELTDTEKEEFKKLL